MDDQVMAADSSRDGGTLPPSLCPKCRTRPRSQYGKSRQPYCDDCLRVYKRENYEKNERNKCKHCGKRLPHRQAHCPVRIGRYRIARARVKISERWPGYAEFLSERVLEAAGGSWPRQITYPPPSQLFINLDPALDQRLIRDRRDKDVTLCQAVAAVPSAEQQIFYELYLVDPIDARHWAALPRWKRAIRKGDTDDQQVFKFFTIQRLFMERAARETVPAWPMKSQGAQLSQTFGTLLYLTPTGLKKLVDVMSSYGDALQYDRDLGDVTKKPWDEKP